MAITNGIIQSVLDYYGSASSIYRKIVLGTATDSEISYAFTQIPSMVFDTSPSGRILGITYADPVYIVSQSGVGIAGDFNSNAAGATYGNSFSGRFPVSFGRDTGTGQAYITGAQKAGVTLASIADRVSLGMVGVNVGAKLGKAIDQTLYNFAPDWWDEHYPTINPDTWTSIVGESEIGQKFFRTLFGIEDNGNVTGYIDEKVIAQTYQMLRDNGVFDVNDISYTYVVPDTQPSVGSITQPVTTSITSHSYSHRTNSSNGYILVSDLPCTTCLILNRNYATQSSTGLTMFSNSPFKYGSTWNNIEYLPPTTQDAILNYTRNGTPFYYANRSISSGEYDVSNVPPVYISSDISRNDVIDVATIIFDGQSYTPVSVPGITDMTGAIQYPPTNITGNTLDDVLTQLKQEYPQLFDGAITETVLQPDGTVDTVTYVPIPWVTDAPENVTETAPITRPDAQQTDYLIDQTTASDIIATPQTQPQPDDGTGEPPPVYPDTGDGSAPPPVTPVGSASSLWAVYNPTQAEVNAFGGWLWSPDFIDNLLKLFSDPMQAIIGIHKIFAAPATGATQPIKCGFLTSTVNSKIVTSQYTTVDCGSVRLPEFFGNVLDYSPHTRVRLFLPFIGFVSLDVGEVMRSTVAVKYTVDVITGACLADVTVTRDGGGGSLYSYGGSCAVHYPVSAGSYTGVISAIAGAALSVVTGNPIGAIHAAMGAHTSVSHSGGFTGSAGAMGIKIPYLVIDRPQSNIATDFPALDGYGSNYSCKVGDLRGVVRCKDVHVECPRAYADELREIEELLKGGVIV